MLSIFGSCAPVSATPGLCYVGLTKPLGPVLHEKGGLTAIDLDVAEGQTLSPVQLSIIANFNSYTEISASGRGVHVFALGSFGKGLRHASVEIYSQGRFMALTGNHYGEPRAWISLCTRCEAGSRGCRIRRKDAANPIRRRSHCCRVRGNEPEKFKTLREGQWRDLYGSLPEADFGYIYMLWFHSRHREQTRPLFRASVLGEHDKLGAKCRSFT